MGTYVISGGVVNGLRGLGVASRLGLAEPDLSVVARDRNKAAHPDEAFLIIEVADSSLKLDRQEKAELYARVGVPEYWVVNVAGRIIERHSEPTTGTYARVTPFRASETASPLALPDGGGADRRRVCGVTVALQITGPRRQSEAR